MEELTLQSSHTIISQSVLRQHTPDSSPQDFRTTPLLHHTIHGNLLQATRASGVAVVLFLITLLSGSVQVVQTYCNNVVSAVG